MSKCTLNHATIHTQRRTGSGGGQRLATYATNEATSSGRAKRQLIGDKRNGNLAH